jgi:hypothetical protein
MPPHLTSYRGLGSIHMKHLKLGATADILDTRNRLKNIPISYRGELNFNKQK